METISLQCNSRSQIYSSAENSMTGRAYMGEVLIQVWLRTSELLDKQVNAQKESLKSFWGSHKLQQAHKKGMR